jgi:UDP-N-acetylglucosamine 2-epimerase
MLDQVLDVFDIRPDYDLDIMTEQQSLVDISVRTLARLDEVLPGIAPDLVMVQGDAAPCFLGALAAFYRKIPVAHVEAGLRSGQRWSPYPEEINRRVIDQIADLLFAPTRGAAAHLVDEGFAHDRVRITGNTVVDALLAIRDRLQAHPVEVPGLEALDGKRLVLVTAHRRESLGEPLLAMCKALRQIARDNPDVAIVYPVHLNPNVAGPVRSLLGGQDRIALLPPLDYLQFVSLLARAHLVLTDSGGVQEEAPTFGKPVLVLRQVTERPEGISAGVARLVGTAARDIVNEANRLLRDPVEYRVMAAAANPYGDGTAALQIVKHLERWARPRKVA